MLATGQEQPSKLTFHLSNADVRLTTQTFPPLHCLLTSFIDPIWRPGACRIYLQASKQLKMGRFLRASTGG
jgi:hypothetical protein